MASYIYESSDDGLEIRFEATPYRAGRAAVDVDAFLQSRGIDEHLKCSIVARELAMDLTRHLTHRQPPAVLSVVVALQADGVQMTILDTSTGTPEPGSAKHQCPTWMSRRGLTVISHLSDRIHASLTANIVTAFVKFTTEPEDANLVHETALELQRLDTVQPNDVEPWSTTSK